MGLQELFKEHNEEFKYRVGVNRVKGTCEQYLHSYKVLEKFLWIQFQMKDITFKSAYPQFY